MPGSVMSEDPLPLNPNPTPASPHARLDQVDEQIKFLDAMISQLRQDKEESDALLRDARTRIIELEASSRASKSHSSTPKMTPPPMFGGNREDVIPFLSKCDLNFQASPSSFSDERLKILYAASRLEGPPYAWFHPLNERYNDPT